MYSNIRKRRMAPLNNPLPSLLVLLIGDIRENKYYGSKLSLLIRLCIDIDVLDTSFLSYIPSYYTRESNIRAAVFQDMAKTGIIAIKKNLLFHKFKIVNFEIYKTLHSHIDEYLNSTEEILRYDILILCMLYLNPNFAYKNTTKIKTIIYKYKNQNTMYVKNIKRLREILSKL